LKIPKFKVQGSKFKVQLARTRSWGELKMSGEWTEDSLQLSFWTQWRISRLRWTPMDKTTFLFRPRFFQNPLV